MKIEKFCLLQLFIRVRIEYKSLGQLANNEENEQDGFVLTVILLAI
jgi:hypothetical protein